MTALLQIHISPFLLCFKYKRLTFFSLFPPSQQIKIQLKSLKYQIGSMRMDIWGIMSLDSKGIQLELINSFNVLFASL